MPGGHASHKGTSAKPNVNTNGNIDPDYQDPQPEEGYPYEPGEEIIRQSSAATERAEKKSDEAPEEA